jgi:hypothetical protein
MRRTRDMEATLSTKGFRRDNDHHRMYWLYVNGKKTSVRTYFSHGLKEYDRNLLGCIQKQLRLATFDELNRLLDCPMRYEDYLGLLASRGHLKLDNAQGKPKEEKPTKGKKGPKK